MKYLLDTNVYVALLRDRAYLVRAEPTLRRILPATWLSSVVLHELLAGARGEIGRAAVRRSVRALVRSGRVVAPDREDWATAGVVRGRIRERHPSTRTRELQNDILVVCSARKVGAIVVTENIADFRLVGEVLRHEARGLAALDTV